MVAVGCAELYNSSVVDNSPIAVLWNICSTAESGKQQRCSLLVTKNIRGTESRPWDGDKRQWRRYKRDELFSETEEFDVESSMGARLLSRISGAAKKFTEPIERNGIGRATGANKRHSRWSYRWN